MGMDVYGKNPTTEDGKYFQNNAWWWQRLADYACDIAPSIANKCKYWHTNDGDGLNAEDSNALSDILQIEIDSGRTASEARLWKSKQEMTPDEPCDLCEGTGTRKPVPDRGAGDPKTDGIKCNACKGRGFVRPYNYPFSVENVQKFVQFLRGCGGFEIY
jgi:hypothetical protein